MSTVDANSSTDTKKILLVRQNSLKKKTAWKFYTIYEQKFSNLIQSLFPKDPTNLKSLDIRIQVGAKRYLNRVNKCQKKFI